MPGFEIRAFTSADIPAAVALALAQGWRDRTRFYEFALRVRTCHFLAGVVDGQVVATGLATVSMPVGWIGAIIVDEAFRRRGYGRAMTDMLCERLLAAGCTTLTLEATNAGRPLYERMGFRPATHYHQLQAGYLPEAPALPAGARVRRLEAADLSSIFELDRRATGEDRSAPLRLLAENGGWMLENDRDRATPAPLGFLLPAERSYGAIVAPRFEDGLFLLDWHRHVVPDGGWVRAGVPHEHGRAWEELQTRGWQETWRAPRLILGPDIEWRPKWIWGQMNSAMG
jgi:ribosomal protein S18 acetylase RimI-like enzyme